MRLQCEPAISMTTKAYRVRKRIPSKALRRSKRLEQVAKDSDIAAVNPLPSPQSEQGVRDSKRKRAQEIDHIANEEPPLKKAFLRRTTSQPDPHDTGDANEDYGPSIRWKDYFDDWPQNSSSMAANMRESRPVKRAHPLSRSNSYSQSVREGSSPVAWTRHHEEKMRDAGLVMMEHQNRASITDDCQQVCGRLLKAEYTLPEGPSFDAERFIRVLEGAQFRNEARIVRDITPIVVPSAELLHIDGHASLANICEAMNAEWTQCDTLCGPRPKPDFVAGISGLAFTDEEKEKLRLIHTSSCPNLFPENMYFPFLICEVKGSDRPVREAERQAMHTASIAIRAVIQLYRKISAAIEVHRKILAFSIAHDNSTVKIFGHFATIEDEKTTFFRHRLYAADFAADLAPDELGRAYKITRAIYENFFPQHLARIKTAISQLRSPSLASFTDQLGLDEDSRESTPGQSSSQEDGNFKKPSLPSEMKLQQENERLRDRLLESLREQQAESQRQREDQQVQKAIMERQLTQQKAESQEQKAMMERQLTQQKEQMERQLAQQKEQMEQQREIIRLLKESKSK